MEEWKVIPGYEGLYEASSLGRIRTAEGKTTSSARFPVRVWKQRIMKLKYTTRRGGKHRDARVCLWKDGKEKTFLVARLVAMTWCKGYTDGMTVNHIDGNPENNIASNLEWITLRENILHGFANRLYPQKECSLVDQRGNVLRFRSQSEASRFLGHSESYMTTVIKRGKPIRSSKGEAYDLA